MLQLFKKKKSNNKPVSKEEIAKVIRELFPTKALGLNCFKVTFPKIVKKLVIRTFFKLYKSFEKGWEASELVERKAYLKK